jgi:hypothetical protein
MHEERIPAGNVRLNWFDPEGADHVRYLVHRAELELIDREYRMVERQIRKARFPAPCIFLKRLEISSGVM